jgi:hypothetical protein
MGGADGHGWTAGAAASTQEVRTCVLGKATLAGEVLSARQEIGGAQWLRLMEPSLPSFGAVAKIFTWVADLFAMPGRVKLLAEATKSQTDPRPICVKCGVGRVAFDATVRNQSNRQMYVGKCTGCSQSWYTSADGRTLHNPAHD